MKPIERLLTVSALMVCVALCGVGCDDGDRNVTPPSVEPVETPPEPTPVEPTPVETPDETSAISPNFPDDVPVYPGTVFAKFQEDDSGNMSAILTTPDGQDPVSTFYRDDCAAKGWNESRTTSGITAGATYILSYTKGARFLSITITRKEDSPITSITTTMSAG